MYLDSIYLNYKEDNYTRNHMIDLTTYIVDNLTLNDAIIDLYASGGGKKYYTNNKQFWEDIKKNGLNTKFYLKPNWIPVFLELNTQNFTRHDNGNLYCIELNFMICLSNNWEKITVNIADYDSELEITLFIEALSELKINLLDYGIDAIALFAQGGGTSEIINGSELFNLINNYNKPISLILSSNQSNIKVEVPATKAGYIDGYDQLSAVATISHNGINTLHLIIRPTQATLLVQKLS